MAALVGEEAQGLPDLGTVSRVGEKLARLKPGANVDAVASMLQGLRRSIDQAEQRILPKAAE